MKYKVWKIWQVNIEHQFVKLISELNYQVEELSQKATGKDNDGIYKENKDFWRVEIEAKGFPGGTVVESLPANAGDMGLSPGLGRSHMPRSN